MKLQLAAFAALASTTLAPVADLRFAAEKGKTWHKTFQEQTTSTLDSVEEIFDGSSSPGQAPDMTLANSRRLVVIDTYDQVDGGVATKLTREFDTVEGKSTLDFEVQGVAQNIPLDMTSELDDLTVIFERKDKSSEPTAKFSGDSKASSKLLEGLREDLDLRAFLTEEGVGEGDWWKVDAATLADVLSPGGDLRLAPHKGSLSGDVTQFLDPTEVLGATLMALDESVDGLAGEVLCTWKETKKDGEREIAVIELDWESTSKTDVSERVQRRLAAAGAETPRDNLSIVGATTTKGEGQLEWDLKANHVSSLTLKFESKFDVRYKYTQEGADSELRFVLSADTERKAEFEVK